jgi:hypothetical protein
MLRISQTLDLPIEVVTMTQAVLARKRSGKSYAAQKLAEQMLTAGQQIVAIDPTSAWWGLRSSADGNGPGYPIVVMGGDHADAPLDHRSGEMLARAVVEHGFSVIFDVGNMEMEEQVMHVFMDEAHNWAPQNPITRPEKHALSAVTKMVLQGGIRGIGFTMISQRSALLNKNILSQVDLLMVLRMSHPLDIATVTEWVKSEVGADFATEVKAGLPSLPIGTAYFCSAPLGLGQRIVIAPKETFNSGATPKPGERKEKPKVLAPIDIAKLGEQIAATIKEDEANSPEALRRRIAELERAPKGNSEREAMLVEQIQKMEEELRELRGREANIQQAKETVSALQKALATASEVVGDLAALLYFPPSEEQHTPRNLVDDNHPLVRGLVQPNNGTHSNNVTTADLSAPQARILEALARCLSIKRARVTKPWVAFLAGASPKSSAFTNNLGALRSKGFIDYENGLVYLTENGRKSVHVSNPMSERELHDRIVDMLPAPQGRILNLLLNRRGKSIERPKLAELANASPTSSAYTNNLGAMRSLGLIEYGSGSTSREERSISVRRNDGT